MERLFAAFNKLGTRERAGAIIALVVALYFLMDVVLISGETKRQKALKAEVARLDSELQGVRSEMVVVKAQLDRDPFAKDRATLDSYKRVIDEAAAFVAKVESDPRAVGAVLRQVLGSTPGVTLVSLKTLPVVAVTDLKSSGGPKQAMTKSIYRRGIEISIKGNYLALLPYLEKLQNMQTRVLWSEAELDARGYPDATLKLTIHTLSSQPEASLG